MASPVGGQFLVGAPAGFSAVTLGINDGTSPIFPVPASGTFNIEVFTAFGVTTLPTLDSVFQAGILRPGGTHLMVGTSGPNTIVGGSVGPDTITGGSATVNIASLGPGDVVSFGNQTGNATVNATGGNVSATFGAGNATIFGGANDVIALG